MKKQTVKKGDIYRYKVGNLNRYIAVVSLLEDAIDPKERCWNVKIYDNKPKYYSDEGRKDWFREWYINDALLIGTLTKKPKDKVESNLSRLESIE